jgi:hypothetical protein
MVYFERIWLQRNLMVNSVGEVAVLECTGIF